MLVWGKILALHMTNLGSMPYIICGLLSEAQIQSPSTDDVTQSLTLPKWFYEGWRYSSGEALGLISSSTYPSKCCARNSSQTC